VVTGLDEARVRRARGAGGRSRAREDRGKSRPAHVISTLNNRFEGVGFTHDRRPHIFVVPVAAVRRSRSPTGLPMSGRRGRRTAQRIAFVAERHETRDTDVNDAIYEVAADGGEPRRISPTLAPMWAPHTHPMDERSRTPVCASPRTLQFPRVAPTDGRQRAPLSGRGAGPIGVGCRAARVVRRRRVGAVPSSRSWHLSALPCARKRWRAASSHCRADADGQWVLGRAGDGSDRVHATEPTTPTELFVCNADGSGERQLTHLNREMEREVELSSRSASAFNRDASTSDAWVMKAGAFDPAKRYRGSSGSTAVRTASSRGHLLARSPS